MSDNSFRIVSLNAILVILLGMFAGGMPLVLVVAQDAYHQSMTLHLAGDYRAWLMAHLEGLLNGLLMIALASVTRLRSMAPVSERVFVPSLLAAGWGNEIASLLAPLLGVRGMIFDSNPGNDLVAAIFTIALVGSVAAMVIAIRHLAVKGA
jgi:hypothetical protein